MGQERASKKDLHLMKKGKTRQEIAMTSLATALMLLVVVVISIAVGLFFLLPAQGNHLQSTTVSTTLTSSYSTTSAQNKPIILYVNQGNGRVDQSNFNTMLTFASSQGFNTIFFQIYRSGNLLFSTSELGYFVSSAHASRFKIFFALYFTNSSQQIPTSIYNLGEDGISLDMSTLDQTTQSNLLSTLKSNYHGGLTAVTTLDFTTTLKPDWLILETYGTGYQQYIHKGIIASVGVFATTSKQDYEQQFEYALNNSDGVMVFDYAGLVSSGY